MYLVNLQCIKRFRPWKDNFALVNAPFLYNLSSIFSCNQRINVRKNQKQNQTTKRILRLHSFVLFTSDHSFTFDQFNHMNHFSHWHWEIAVWACADTSNFQFVGAKIILRKLFWHYQSFMRIIEAAVRRCCSK